MSQKITVVDAAMYYRVFEQHAEGALVLEDLIRRFSQPPVYKDGIDGVRISDHRAGARSVVDFIVRQLNKTNGVQDHEPEE